MAKQESVYDKEFYERQRQGSLNSATVVAPIVFELTAPKSVVDIGCGVGTWLAAFEKLGVMTIRGIDGDYIPEDALAVDRRAVSSADLSLPLPNLGRFGLAMSVEVAEHLPGTRADSFVRDLAKLSDTVLFSAAVPHQGGTGHVNEQMPSYWAQKFANEGYDLADVLRPQIWADSRVEWWYRQNLLLFVKRGSANHGICGGESPLPLDIYHPECVTHRVNMMNRWLQGAKKDLAKARSNQRGLNPFTRWWQQVRK